MYLDPPKKKILVSCLFDADFEMLRNIENNGQTEGCA